MITLRPLTTKKDPKLFSSYGKLHYLTGMCSLYNRKGFIALFSGMILLVEIMTTMLITKVITFFWIDIMQPSVSFIPFSSILYLHFTYIKSSFQQILN